MTPPRGYSHAVQRGLPQAVPALSLACHGSVFPPRGWTEVNGAGQGKTVREGINTLWVTQRYATSSVSPNRGSTQGKSMAPAAQAHRAEMLSLEVKTESTLENQGAP